MNVLAIYKKTTGEFYNFHFDSTKASYTELLAILGRFAADTELSFTWHDAALLIQKAQRIRKHIVDFKGIARRVLR